MMFIVCAKLNLAYANTTPEDSFSRKIIVNICWNASSSNAFHAALWQPSQVQERRVPGVALCVSVYVCIHMNVWRPKLRLRVYLYTLLHPIQLLLRQVAASFIPNKDTLDRSTNKMKDLFKSPPKNISTNVTQYRSFSYWLVFITRCASWWRKAPSGSRQVQMFPSAHENWVTESEESWNLHLLKLMTVYLIPAMTAKNRAAVVPLIGLSRGKLLEGGRWLTHSLKQKETLLPKMGKKCEKPLLGLIFVSVWMASFFIRNALCAN